jgi:hypothetical protein
MITIMVLCEAVLVGDPRNRDPQAGGEKIEKNDQNLAVGTIEMRIQ